MQKESLESKIEKLRCLLLNKTYITQWRYQRYYLHTWLAIHNFLPLIVEILFDFSKSFSSEFDYIGALGRSGLALASSLSLRYYQEGQYKPMIYVGEPIIGKYSKWDPPIKPSISQEDLKAGSKVMLIDTVMRTGYTAEDAVDKLLEYNIQPKYLLVLADYEKTVKEFRPSVEEILKYKVEIKKIFSFEPKEGKDIDQTWLVPFFTKIT